MSKISKNTFKKITLLYFIGRFRNGAYSNYRVQKVLYFATKAINLHPFPYRHTEHGQYSRDARENIDSLIALGLIDITGLKKTEETGFKLAINSRAVNLGLTEILPKINPTLAQTLDASITEYGYLKNEEIKRRTHDDPLLKNTPFGQILFDENLPDYIEVDLSDSECEDLELLLNEKFMICMDRLVSAIEATDFDFERVEKVASVL